MGRNNLSGIVCEHQYNMSITFLCRSDWCVSILLGISRKVFGGSRRLFRDLVFHKQGVRTFARTIIAKV